METLLADLRHAWRALRTRPAFTSTVVLTLALGIGGTTAIFSLATAVLLGRLPFRDVDRLVMLWEDASVAGFPRNDVAPGNYARFRQESRLFEGLAAVEDLGLNLTGEGEPLKVVARGVTSNFFSVLGVAPALGRSFEADEDVPGARHVAVLSHGLWQRRFGGDPSVVGRDVLLDGEKYAVIGVMPRHFQFLDPYVTLWVPAAFSAEELQNHGAHYLNVVGRLKPGVDLDRAGGEVAEVARRISREFPAGARELRAFLLPLREQLVGDARRPLLTLSLAMLAVLLIACANVAGLLLVRGTSREREIAVRAALGAGRRRIARQLLTESVLLAFLGAIPGIAVAAAVLSFLQELVPPALTLFTQPTVDPRALALALGLSLVTGVVFGLAPALHAATADVRGALQQGSRGTIARPGPRRLRSLLLVSETAATLVLLVGAGLLGQTLYRMRYAELGLTPSNVLTLRTVLPERSYGAPAKRAAFYEDVLSRVRHLPGVVSAGYGTSVPLEWKGGTSGFVPENLERFDRTLSYDANHRQVTTGFLETLAIPLLRGRPIEAFDGPESRRVALINETMARQYWPGVDPLGRRFKLGDPDSDAAWVSVVGIVGDVRQMGLDQPTKAEMYLPSTQVPDQPWFAPRDLVVRTTGEPVAVVRAVKDAIAAVDASQAVSNVRSFDAILDEQVAERRVGVALVAAFSALALLLASLGIYGLVSYHVAQHTAEIGVRVALGAGQSEILRLVLWKGMSLALLGVALGAAFCLALTRLIASLLYGVRAADPATYMAAAAVLLAAAAFACYIPALRAIRVEPSAAIRCE
jgi:predicted permease